MEFVDEVDEELLEDKAVADDENMSWSFFAVGVAVFELVVEDSMKDFDDSLSCLVEYNKCKCMYRKEE